MWSSVECMLLRVQSEPDVKSQLYEQPFKRVQHERTDVLF